MGAGAVLDPRPGGIFRITFELPPPVIEAMAATFGPGPDHALEAIRERGANVVIGEFVEVDPHRRIVFTWGYEEELFELPPQSTAVEVSFIPEGDGTLLRLIHRRLPAAATAFHRGGWEHYLLRLGVVAAGGDPGPDPWQAAAD
jgi:uncharacterized protein YndB with AHSA1/START domain